MKWGDSNFQMVTDTGTQCSIILHLITRFYEEHYQPSSGSAWPACQKMVIEPLMLGQEGQTNMHRVCHTTACILCLLEPNLLLLKCWTLREELVARLQTTQPTSGGAVTADKNCCANCVEPSRPQQWGPDLPFFGHAGHADPLDGWRCCSQKRVMSRPIQVRQH